jgi:acetyl-CoA C-acetyltransferase
MPAANIPDQTPVIIGVGQITERIESPDYRGLSNVELAVEAARRACDDAAGVARLVPQIDTIAALRTFEHSTPQYASPFGKSNNFPHSIARRLGITPGSAIWAPAGGDSPQNLVSELCEKIAGGSVRTALLAGSEAISTARHLAARKETRDWAEDIDVPVDDRGLGMKGLRTRYGRQHKIMGGPDSYALLETARRARLGLSREAHAIQMGELFAPFSRVAAGNPYATAPVAYTASELIAVTERNRMIASPYTRLLVARDQVNQAAAIVLTSVGVARSLGIPEAKWVYLHGYAKATEREIERRADLGVALSAQLASKAALHAADIQVNELSYLDLYSCFPVAVFNVCDGLGLAHDDPRGLTVTGGLPYFGGPGNSYSTHAIVTMVERLRAQPGSYGLVGANGGHLSKYSVGVYSTRAREFRYCDSSAIQAQVDAQPDPGVAFEADGTGVIETYTVVYDKDGPTHAIVVGRLDATGERFFANTHETDRETLDALIGSDPLGRKVFVRSFGVGNRVALRAGRLAELFPAKVPRLRDKYEFMLVERRGRVLEITMNRPEMRNALHPPAHEELDEIFDAFFADPELWVAILTGAGKDSFTAGNDLKYSAKHPVFLPKSGFAALTTRGGRTKPIIAAVNGFALGGGLEICMCCELVVADAKSRFGLTEVQVGVVAGAGGLIRLPRRVPKMLAYEMILTGRRLSAEEALAVGLINRITPDGEALEGARQLAAEILKASPTSVRLSLQIMRDTEVIADELAAARLRHPALDELQTSEDFIEGPVAFAQKRQPKWKNR